MQNANGQKYPQIYAYFAKKSPEPQTEAKNPRSSEKTPAVATLYLTTKVHQALAIINVSQMSPGNPFNEDTHSSGQRRGLLNSSGPLQPVLFPKQIFGFRIEKVGIRG